MAIALTVFYRDGLKIGPAAEAATFGQWLVEPKVGPFPGSRRLVGLSIGSQDGNVYRLQPITTPLGPSSQFVTIRVSVPSLPGRDPIRAAGSTEVGLNDGGAVEVWV